MSIPYDPIIYKQEDALEHMLGVIPPRAFKKDHHRLMVHMDIQGATLRYDAGSRNAHMGLFVVCVRRDHPTPIVILMPPGAGLLKG